MPATCKSSMQMRAYLIPVGSIEISKLPDTAKNKKLIVHCKFGKQGSQACEKLLHENSNFEIYNIDGGITAWEDAGFSG